MEETTLQRIIAQKTNQIRTAIEEAIDAGAKIDKPTSGMVSIDGVNVWQDFDNTFSVFLKITSDKFAKAFAPSKDELEKLAAKKRAELEKIENQIKERAQQ